LRLFKERNRFLLDQLLGTFFQGFKEGLIPGYHLLRKVKGEKPLRLGRPKGGWLTYLDWGLGEPNLRFLKNFRWEGWKKG